jgi:hypothetical protein
MDRRRNCTRAALVLAVMAAVVPSDEFFNVYDKTGPGMSDC